MDGSATAKDIVYDWFTRHPWTESQYLLFANARNALIELSEGKAVIHAMPTPQHQTVAFNIASLLRASRAGRTFIAPMPVQLWPGKMREPDVLFYRTENLGRVGEEFGGPPDLAVEVLSPSTRALDLGDKLREYARAGVAEYWIADPEARTLSVHALAGGAFGPGVRHGPGEVVASEVVTDVLVRVDDAFALA